MPFIFAAAFGGHAPLPKKQGADFSPAQSEEAIRADSSIVILDVRTLDEYRSETGHLHGALLIPVQELERRLGELAPYRDKLILIYCRVGNRSKLAQMILESRGFRAVNMSGGITQWNDENRPVVQEPTGI